MRNDYFYFMEAEKKARGRKPITDRKIRIYLYVTNSLVQKNGGEEELKGYLYQRIQARAKNRK